MFISPILPVRKRRLREVKCLAQGHTDPGADTGSRNSPAHTEWERGHNLFTPPPPGCKTPPTPGLSAHLIYTLLLDVFRLKKFPPCPGFAQKSKGKKATRCESDPKVFGG